MANLIRVRDLLEYVRSKLKENHKELYDKMDYVGTTIWDTENYILWTHTQFVCIINPYGSEGVYVDVNIHICDIDASVPLFSAKTLYEDVEGYGIAGEIAGLIHFYADKFLIEKRALTVSLSMTEEVDSFRRDNVSIFELKETIEKMEKGEIKEFRKIRNISYLKQLHNHYFIGEGVKRCAQLCSEPANAEYVRFFLRDIPDNDGLLG